MPVARRRLTACGTKPIRKQQPGYKSFYLYGATRPETGQHFLLEQDRLNSDGFQVFLDGFARAFPQSHNVMILDNGSFHKAKKLTAPSNVGLIFLPPYSPELNPVERFWEEINDQVAIDQVALDGEASLAALRQQVRIHVWSYAEETVASLTGYPYLMEAVSALSS